MEIEDFELEKLLEEELLKKDQRKQELNTSVVAGADTKSGVESKVKSETKPETKPEMKSDVRSDKFSVKEGAKEKDFVSIIEGGEFSFGFESFTPGDLVEPDVAPPTSGKETILIAGDKNAGKSVAALSFPGKVAVIAFDEKIFAARDYVVKHGIKREEDIMIYYPAKHYNPKAVDDREIGQAAVAVVNEAFRAVYSIKIRADAKKFVPDWVFFDNLEFFIRLAEFAGKYRRGVPITTRPQEGSDVWGAFDVRNIITNVIYKTAISIPSRGVIYTLYTKEKDVILPDGTIKKTQVPKWFELLMYETDHHIVVWKNDDRYFAKIIGTKDEEKYPDGLTIEITGRGLWDVISSSRKSGNLEVL